jgi:hypothetical protein
LSAGYPQSSQIPHPGHFDGLFRDCTLSYLFSFAEELYSFYDELYSFYDDEGLETDFSEFDGFFLGLGCTDDEAVVWKVPEQILVKLDVDQCAVDLFMAQEL